MKKKRKSPPSKIMTNSFLEALIIFVSEFFITINFENLKDQYLKSNTEYSVFFLGGIKPCILQEY